MSQKELLFVLLTRFSVRSRKFMNMVGIREEFVRKKWFQYRADLFRSITYPSLIAQNYHPDRWVLLCSEGDEDMFNNYMSDLEEWVVPLFLRQGKSMAGQADDYICTLLGEKKDLLLSRIDSDDALVPDYYENILDVALERDEKELVLMYRHGCRWDGRSVQNMDYPNNPFISICVKDWVKNRLSPLKMEHTDILSYNHCFVDKAKEPSWLQVLHGANASNEFKEKYGDVHLVDFDEIMFKYNIKPNSLNAIRAMKEQIVPELRNCDS